VLLIEVGQLTPPLGINLFVIQSIWPGKLSDVIAGTVPFFFLVLLMMGIMVFLPGLATWLPSYMAGN
jgi:TRAP-type C4-dicarboxylate transport system permease large subunit